MAQRQKKLLQKYDNFEMSRLFVEKLLFYERIVLIFVIKIYGRFASQTKKIINFAAAKQAAPRWDEDNALTSRLLRES